MATYSDSREIFVEFPGIVTVIWVSDDPEYIGTTKDLFHEQRKGFPDRFGKKDKTSTEQGYFHCNICDCDLKSVVLLRIHCKGEKHRRKVLKRKGEWRLEMESKEVVKDLSNKVEYTDDRYRVPHYNERKRSYGYHYQQEGQQGDDQPLGCFGEGDLGSREQESKTSGDPLFIFNSKNTGPSVQRQELSKPGPINTGVCSESQGKTAVSSADVPNSAPISSTKEYCALSPSKPPTNNLAASPPFLPPSSPSQFAVPCSIPTPSKKPRLCSMEEELETGASKINGGQQSDFLEGREEESFAQSRSQQENRNEMKKGKNAPSWESDGISSSTGVSGMMCKLLDEQQKKLGNIVREIQQAEKKEEQLMAFMEQILRDAQEFKQRLSGIKKTYSDKLSQVSSFLNLESNK